MAKWRTLDHKFQPRMVKLKLDVKQQLIHQARKELYERSQVDSNNCFGYFPALANQKDIDTTLPSCEALAKTLPKIVMDHKELRFNFIRLSTVQQKGTSPFHLDTDAATALTGNIATLDQRLVWRLLINLNQEAERTLGYLDVNIHDVSLSNDGGYVHCVDKQAEKQRAQKVTLPRAKGTEVYAVLFCASRVLHTGKDDINGHFVAGYGCEEDED